MDKLAILDRAYDKSEKSEPGKPAKLFPMEDKVLRKALRYSYKLFRIRYTYNKTKKWCKEYNTPFVEPEFARIGYPIERLYKEFNND